MGLVLAVAPWTSLWDSNWLLQPWPSLRALAQSGFTRGAVSGLGLVNLLTALHDVLGLVRAVASRRSRP